MTRCSCSGPESWLLFPSFLCCVEPRALEQCTSRSGIKLSVELEIHIWMLRNIFALWELTVLIGGVFCVFVFFFLTCLLKHESWIELGFGCGTSGAVPPRSRRQHDDDRTWSNGRD